MKALLVLQLKLNTLMFSKRTLNCFKTAGIERVIDLVCMRESALLQIPNFGKTSLEECKKMLGMYGFSIGMTWKEAEELSFKAGNRNVIQLKNDCEYRIFRGYGDNCRPYEEGVLDTINWLIYNEKKPELL